MLHLRHCSLFCPHTHFVQHLAFTSSSASVSVLRRREITTRCSVTSAAELSSYGAVSNERTKLEWDTLYRKISLKAGHGVGPAVFLDEWVREGRGISKWNLCRIVKELRKFKRHKLALEVYDWMEAQGQSFTLTCSDIAIQLDLIAKVYGVSRAEKHFSELPDSLKDKRTYGALLNVYGKAKMKEKAEGIFEAMRTKGYAVDSLPYNVMLTLYLNVGEHEKVRALICEMKGKNVAFDVYTYNLWITNSGAMEDIDEMERIMGEIISENSVNTSWTIYTTFAAIYIRLGNFEKAESFLKDAELRVTGMERAAFNHLIGLYANIGKSKDVYRIWQWYKTTFPSVLNMGYRGMISSLLKLRDAAGAKDIYDEWLFSTQHYDPRICDILIRSYARDGLVDEAKDVLDSFVDKGGKPIPITWELMAEGHIKKKQLSKSLLYLRAAVSYQGASRWQPKPTNISNFLSLCKEQNDKESEKMLMDLLREGGFHLNREYRVGRL